MRIKHLQLNTTVMKEPEKIADFIVDSEIDIACMQEICYEIKGKNKLQKLLEKSNYHYVEGIHFHYLPKNQTIGVAIASKYPIKDYVKVYYNTDTYQPKNISDQDFLGNEIIEDDIKAEEFPASRGVKHAAKSRCILLALLETPKGRMRAVTTHFTVSDLCTETTQMYEMANLVTSLIQNAKPVPTIFSADLNIRAKSYSVQKLSEALTCHTADIVDTLSNKHVAKEKDFPKGLAIDHVFSADLQHNRTEAKEVDFSGHKAVVSEFEVSSFTSFPRLSS